MDLSLAESHTRPCLPIVWILCGLGRQSQQDADRLIGTMGVRVEPFYKGCPCQHPYAVSRQGSLVVYLKREFLVIWETPGASGDD